MKNLGSILDMNFPEVEDLVDREMTRFKKARMISSYTFNGKTIKVKAKDNLKLDGTPLATAGLHLDFSGRSYGTQYRSETPCVGGTNYWKEVWVGHTAFFTTPLLKDVSIRSNMRQMGGVRCWSKSTPIRFENVKLDVSELDWIDDAEDCNLNGIEGWVGILRLSVNNMNIYNKIFPTIGPRNQDLDYFSSTNWNRDMPGDVYPNTNLSKMFGISSKLKVDVINIIWWEEKRRFCFVHKSAWKGPKHLAKDSFITADGYIFVNNQCSDLRQLTDDSWYDHDGQPWTYRPQK